MYALKSAMSKAWGLRKHLDVKEIERNVFLFTFEDVNERLRAMVDGPWNFNGNHLVLKEWLSNQRIQDVDFSKSEFWVQVHGPVPEQMSLLNARDIGDFIGRYVMADDLAGDGLVCFRLYMRIRALVPVEEPLKKGFMNEREDGSIMEVEFRITPPPPAHTRGLKTWGVEEEMRGKLEGVWMRAREAVARQKGEWRARGVTYNSEDEEISVGIAPSTVSQRGSEEETEGRDQGVCRDCMKGERE
ncbi:hypothetical protein Tsubulata_024875 [Turnera subulata]|uniref:DUF4283 domain-containing protein n=1 Tax=Turnera subulata TaxID=218843 RepID=A0A9Q0J988_9ROSI|nr:hypothetical protein Tsubulata_024875 [Turnera subulata]